MDPNTSPEREQEIRDYANGEWKGGKPKIPPTTPSFTRDLLGMLDEARAEIERLRALIPTCERGPKACDLEIESLREERDAAKEQYEELHRTWEAGVEPGDPSDLENTIVAARMFLAESDTIWRESPATWEVVNRLVEQSERLLRGQTPTR